MSIGSRTHEMIESFGNEPIPIEEEAYAMGDVAEPVPDGLRAMVNLETAPPERVRFTAPAVLKPEGEGELVEGTVINLSLRGVAVVAAWAGGTHDRVWTQFRLGLAEDPVDLLCEVIWCAPRSESGDSLIGMRFAGLTEEEAARIQTVVVERSEGRAGEWPLPVMPESQAVQPTRTTHTWLTAAAGMAAGIGLALAFSALPGGGQGASPMLPARAAPPMVVADAAAPQPPTPSVQPTPPVVEAKAAPALVPANPPVVAAVEPSAKPTLLPRKAPAARQEVDGDVLHPLGTAKGVELALVCDGPVNDHLTFWLESPQRLVVDVYGRKSGFSRRAFRVDNSLARGLRVGQHPDKVRFVIEIAGDVAPHVLARPAGNSLVVELERKS